MEQLEFTYNAEASTSDDSVAIDMSGGAVRLTIPTGWTVPKNMVTVTDGSTVLFLTGATDEAGAATTGVITTSPVDVADLDQRRVTVRRRGQCNTNRGHTRCQLGCCAGWQRTDSWHQRDHVHFRDGNCPGPGSAHFPAR